MTPERLLAIRERLANATPGPWHWTMGYLCGSDGQSFFHMKEVIRSRSEDTHFIAHAPEDIGDLLDEISRLAGELESALAELERQEAKIAKLQHYYDMEMGKGD